MTSKTGKVFISGGTGFIGSSLGKLLENEGYAVKRISREPIRGGLTWQDLSLLGIPEDTVAVINCAGENVLNPTRRWTEDFKKEIHSSRIYTNKFLVDLISESEHKPDLFLSMSGVGIYKPDPVKEYDEYSEIGEGFDYISKLAIEWENSAKLHDNKTTRQVIIRSGVVLGRTGGMIKQIFAPFYFGVGGPIGDGKQWFPWIHLHDLCRLISFSIQNKKVNGILNGVAPQIITNSQFTKSFASALWRPAIFPLPAFVVKAIFGEDRSVMMLKGQKVIPKRVQEYHFDYLYPTIEDATKEFSRLLYAPPKSLHNVEGDSKK